jgi:long-chain acyl-CoA synthetase
MSQAMPVSHPARPWLASWPAALPRSLEYPDQPAWWLLGRNADLRPNAVAVRTIDRRNGQETGACTYGELWQRARRAGGAFLKAGVQPGDRVALVLPNGVDLIAAYYGTWLAAAVAVPCDSMASGVELAHQLRDSDAGLLVCDPHQCERLASLGVALMTDLEGEPADPRSVDPNALAVLMYTGGTTGEPKGAMLSHRNLVCNAIQFGTWYGFEEGAERCVSVLPLFHSGGMAGAMNVPIWAGAELLLLERFNAGVIAEIIERLRATRFFGVPTMYVAMLEDEHARRADLSSLRACRTSASGLPAAVKARFDQLVGHEVLAEGYGLSEASPLTHANPIDRPRAGAIGLPISDTDARIVDDDGQDVEPGEEGELLIRGPQVMQGYWRPPDETATALAGGWLHTGDVARMDTDGYFSIVDRKKEVIISGGFKVWPREVEEVLYEHPAVALDAVVGVPDGYRGEVVKAFVVLRPEERGRVSEEQLRSFVHDRLAPYKAPRVVELVDELPVSHQGKVLRRALREKR